MQLLQEILISSVLVLIGIGFIKLTKKKNRHLGTFTMVSLKKYNEKTRTIVWIVILASIAIGVGILVKNGLIIIKW